MSTHHPNAVIFRTARRSRGLWVRIGLATTVLLAFSSNSLAVEVFTQDVSVENNDPALIFDDASDSDGYEWVIRGRDEFFRIDHDINNQTYLNFENWSVALGRQSSAAGAYATATGYNATAPGFTAAAFGTGADATDTNTTAIGSNTLATASNATALGYRAVADQPDTLVLGSIPGINSGSNYVNVGMGTTNPIQAVDVERSQAAARFQLTSFTNTANEAPQYIQRRARGTTAAPTAVLNNDNLGLFSFRGYNGSTMGGSRATITAQAAGNFTNSSTPTRLIFAVAPTGSTAPEQVLVIENGQVKVNGQNLNVPDYVFEDDYPLMPLEELQTFIDANGHLPGIAPAHEVNANGLDLAGSQMGLLQKVEELTLYTLEQEQRIQQQNERIASLEAQLAQTRAEPDKTMAELMAEVAEIRTLLAGRVVPQTAN